MPKFTLILQDPPPGEYKPLLANPPNYTPGDQLLLVELPLLDLATRNPVGRLIARLTVMKTFPKNGPVGPGEPNNVPLVLGNADHHLPGGIISAQGSWRFGDTKRVFAIIGGTVKYEAARGTITPQDVNNEEQFTYDWH
jgi:hypothetical protein